MSAARPQRRNAGDSAAPLALYERVKEFVTRNTANGAWLPGHRLPSEHDLVVLFGISRMTVNRALRELAEQGRIFRVTGVGSFVAENRPQSTLLQIGNLASEIRQRGHAHRWAVLAVERLAAEPAIGVGLDLAPGEAVFHSVCLHLEDEVPVQLEDRYVNPRMVPDFLDQDFTQMPPGEYLLRHVPFDEIEHVVDAVLPTAEQARQLAMSPADPCLLLIRRTWSRTVPVTMVRCLHPASRYRLGSRFSATAPRAG